MASMVGTIRRFFRRVFPCLLLGAAINVAVAWGCALWSDTGAHTWTLDPIQNTPAAALVASIWGDPDRDRFNTLTTESRGHGIRVTRIEPPQLDLRASWDVSVHYGRLPQGHLYIIESGWPWKSCVCSTVQSDEDYQNSRSLTWRGGLTVPLAVHALPFEWSTSPGSNASGVNGSGMQRRPLPYRPLRWHWLANSALFGTAALLSTLLLDARRAIRRNRARRGRCTKCGYPRGVSAICTECGTPSIDAISSSKSKTPSQTQRNPAS